MSEAVKGQEFIGRLYQLITEYEANRQSLNGDTFRDLYRRIVRAIDLGGESASAAMALDAALFNAVSVEDITRSDLRNLVSHGLTIYHRYHADYGRGFEQAYRWCEQSRQQQLPDLAYIHTFLVPQLLKPDALGENRDLSLFLLEQLGQFENLEGSPVWADEMSADLLQQEPGEIAYQLARRKVKYLADKLTKIPGTLEQHLQKDQAFRKLAREHAEAVPLLVHQIQVYGYLQRESLWKRFTKAINALVRGLVQRMAGDYMAYELTRRKGAYIVQTMLIILTLVGLGMGLFGWSYASAKRAAEVERDLEKAKSMFDELAEERMRSREEGASMLQYEKYEQETSAGEG